MWIVGALISAVLANPTSLPHHLPEMAVVVHADIQKRWIRVRVTGSLSLDDVLGVMKTARADVEHQMWPMLVDARGAANRLTAADIDTIVLAVQASIRTQGMRGHVGLVADDDALYQQLLRYETRCSEIGVRVIRAFRQLPDAERWLDLLSATRYF